MDSAECYRTMRRRMTDLAASLSEEQAGTKVPACPAWTVRDTYAHLAGLAREVVDGTLTTRAVDHDTARQVEQRAGRGLAELCAEWDEVGPGAEELIAGPKGYRYHLMVQDLWSHEQDILGALGLPQARTDVTTEAIAALLVDMYARSWAKYELSPAVRLRTPSVERVIGVGEPAATLETTDFDLVRLLIGRRTAAEMKAAGWTGDVSGLLDRLHFFPVPENSLAE
jgi:uncharacterized protein (TIGR03083 family)